MSTTHAVGGGRGRSTPDAPRLADLMPWSVAPLRLGRGWVMGPDTDSLHARWQALIRAGGADRERLFQPSRARTPRTTVAQLPGQATSTARLARAEGPCPEPVRVVHGAFDHQWLLPDHRLIDVARPELWRVADDHQIFVVEQSALPEPGPAAVFTALLPDGRSPAGKPCRVRPLYRRPGGREPNLAPGLLDHLARRLQRPVGAREFLAWVAALARHEGPACVVPLTAEPEVWQRGVALGERLLRVHTRGLRGGERPRMPGGRRPYVRAALPERGLPVEPVYEAAEEALLLGEGRVSPVAEGAWRFRAGGAEVLRAWVEARVGPVEAGTLAAVRPGRWPSEWTTDLLELVTVLSLLAEARPQRRALARETEGAAEVGAEELRAAGVLPVPRSAQRPASVLDHQEEGPEGQFALL